MPQYRIETTSNGVCHHRGDNPYQAAARHIAAHVSRRKGVRPRAITRTSDSVGTYWQAVVDTTHYTINIHGVFWVGPSGVR